MPPKQAQKTASTHPFYIRHLNANSKTNHIYVFQGKVPPPPDPTTDTPESITHFCDEYIHWDDNIEQIRNKIIRQIQPQIEKPHEIYLFARIKENVDTLAIYQAITKQRDSIDIPITQTQMHQLLLNIGIDAQIPRKQSYTYEEILSYKTPDGKFPFSEQEFIMPIPLGRELYDRTGKQVRDYLFAANPYKYAHRTEIGSNIWVDRSVNSLLLSYSSLVGNTIYMCTPDMPANIMQHYFPVAPSIQKPLRGFSALENSVDFLYELTYTGVKTVSPANILEWTVKIKSPYQSLLPLDTVFANLYTSKMIPFIQYSPGRTRESVIRVRSIFKTFQGESVPTLEMNLLDKILEDTSKKYDAISMYLPPAEDAEIPVSAYLILNKNGDVSFRMNVADKQKPIRATTMEDFIVNTCNPLLEVLNNSLQPIGFSYPDLKKPMPTYVSVTDIRFSTSYTSGKGAITGISTGKFAHVFHNLFDLKTGRGQSVPVIQNDDVFYFSRGGGENTRQALLEYHKYQCGDSITCLAELYKHYVVDHDKVQGRKVLIKPVTALIRSEGGGVFTWYISNVTSLVMMDVIYNYLTALFHCFRGEVSETDEIYNRYFPLGSLKWTVDAIETPDIVLRAAAKMDEEGEDEEEEEEEEEEDELEEDLVSPPPPPDSESVISEPPPVFSDEENEEDIFDGGAETKTNDEINKQTYDTLYAQYNHKNVVKMKQTNGVFNHRRRKLDKDLFYTNDGTARFTSTCQASDERQPVPITDAEYELNRSYFNEDNVIQYGTNGMHYVCPPHYCLPKNMPMTDEDVKQGKCMELNDPKTGKRLPDKTFSDDILPPDAFVYTFKKRIGRQGFYPGVIWEDDKDKSDPKTSSVCCFTLDRAKNKKLPVAAKTVKKAEGEQQQQQPQSRYGPNKDLSKMKTEDFAQLPLNVQLFFQMYEYENKNILDEVNDEERLKTIALKPQLIRYRVENGSFFGCIAEVAAYLSTKPGTRGIETKPVQEFIKELTSKITLDDYIQYDNGALVSLFRPKQMYELDSLDEYSKTQFYQTFLNKDGELEHEDFLEDTVRSFIAFKEYLLANPDMDHTYLWDIAVKNPMYPANQAINLVILDAKHDSITNKVDIICPTNSRHGIFRSELPTLILLRMGENQYEPIYQMEKTARSLPIFVRLFDIQSPNIYIQRALSIVTKISRDLCRPASAITKTTFKTSLPATNVYSQLVKTKLFSSIQRQIQNYRQQTIGLLIEVNTGNSEPKPIFVPCFPSPAIYPGKIPITRMDADIIEGVSMWSDYKTSVDVLKQIADETDIPCRPFIVSIHREELGSYVVGFFTETNQFVKVSPPLPEEQLGDLPDGMRAKVSTVVNAPDSDYINTDVVLATSGNKRDTERLSLIQEKIIDRDYFALFRKLVRDKFTSDKRAEMTRQIASDDIYPQKLQKVKTALIALCDQSVSFQETASEIWAICASNPSDPKCKVMVVEGKIVVPTRKGESKTTRDRYYTRIADELVRYGHMRQIMLLPQTRLVPREEDIRFTPGTNETVTTAKELKTQVEARIDFYKRTGSNLGNVQDIDYEHALPRGPTTKFMRNVNLAEQQKILLDKVVEVKSTDLMQRAKDLISSCAGMGECGPFTAIEMIGNERTGYWKSRFMTGSVEISAGSHKNNIMTLILYQLTGKTRVIRMDGIKTLLGEYMTKEDADKYPLKKTALKQPETLTEQDLYIFAQKYKVPLCLFTTHGFQRTETETNKLVRLYKKDDDPTTEYYFLRTLSDNKSAEGAGRSYLNMLFPPQPIPSDVEIVDVPVI